MTELRIIPNVGKETEQDLIAMGYTTIESLKGKKADDLYAQECALRGCTCVKPGNSICLSIA